VSTTLGGVLAAIGAALLLIGRVAGLPVASHSVGLALLVVGGLVLAYALAVAPRRAMRRNLP
jgi:hypothetical protein